MPLDPGPLAVTLESIAKNPPPTSAACASAWADAVGAFAANVVPPSTTVSAAKSVLATALSGAFASPAAAPAMELAFTAFGGSVAAGMTVGVVGAPPPGPVGFATMFATQPPPATHKQAAETMAGLIFAWMKTGMFNTVPPGTPAPWS